MASPTIITRMGDIIRAYHQRGIPICEAALNYMDAASDRPNDNIQSGILTDADNSERDVLLELLFFPDADLQAQLEEWIEKIPSGKGLEEEMIAELRRQPVMGTFLFPDHRRPLDLAMPSFMIDDFVKRLNLARRSDKRIIRAIEASIPVKLITRLKVRLRNARGTYSDQAIECLCAFIKTYPDTVGSFEAGFDLLLEIFAEPPETGDVFQTLTARKRFYAEALRKAEKFQQQFRKHNMETLMLKGVRAPSVSRSELREKMELIDLICRSVFGRTVFFNDVTEGVVDVNKALPNSS
jgi:hypothetical protein